MLLNKNDSPLYYDFEPNPRKLVMEIEVFQTELTKLVEQLYPILDLIGRYPGAPTYNKGPNVSAETIGLDGLSHTTSSLFEHSWSQSEEWWPSVDPAFYLGTLDRIQLRFDKTEDGSYQRAPELALSISLGEFGHFTMYFDRCYREFQLAAWTYTTNFEDHQTDCSVGYVSRTDEQLFPIDLLPVTSAGNESIFEGMTGLIIDTLTKRVAKVVNSPRIQRIRLNRAHADGLLKFDLADSWDMLPWISVNKHSAQLGEMGECPVSWDQLGPFDVIKIRTKTSDNTPMLTYTVILLGRKNVVQGFVQHENQKAEVMDNADDAASFWGILDQLIRGAHDLLATEL